MQRTLEPLIFEKSSPGHRAYSFPKFEGHNEPLDSLLPAALQRKAVAELPEISEIEIVRHFTRLSQLNFSVDTHFYPLGSCTMKYNPKINDKSAALPGFANIHPYQPDAMLQGALTIVDRLEQWLCNICGMDAFSLQPAAGAHGEFTGMLLVRAYHESRGNRRHKVICPDAAHGTNPSSAHLAGYEVVTVPSAKNGEVDLEALTAALDHDTAAIMLTNPNTHGLFERNILEIARRAHQVGALLYYDGANLNALVGLARPGDMGFDVVHVNLHKTFSTPHGGGGPGAGPVGVKKHLEPFLPIPRIGKRNDQLFWDYNRPQSIGKVRSFYGNFGVLVRAYAYIRAHGGDRLPEISRTAIINANYIKEKLKNHYQTAFEGPCMHECVFTARKQKEQGSSAKDIAKQLLDYGFHAPTIYFPMTVQETIMIEPTETESRQTLDEFIQAMKEIAESIEKDADISKNAPLTMPIRRVDEVKAARELDLSYRKK